MDAVAPARLAEPWDNVGLLLGDRAAGCSRVLVSVDWTPQVLAEAVAVRADAVVSYHPPIFDALKRLDSADPAQAALLGAARAGIALLSPHTAYDAVQGGMTDWLAEGLAGGPRELARASAHEALRPASRLAAGERFKLVAFVPAAASGALRAALADAGAGRIGAYDHCTTRHGVTGSFRGGEGTRPAVGRRGRVEEVAEERVETVVSAERLPWAIAAMRAVHPYEEPAFEVHALSPRPSLDEGAGRLLELRRDQPLAAIAARLRRFLGAPRVDAVVAGARHRRIAVCPGAGAGFLPDAVARGATLLVTGEARHHEQLAARAAGVSMLLAGHAWTERGCMPRLARALSAALPGATFLVASSDAPPLTDPGARPRPARAARRPARPR
jgi:dinuclear metal center YbgI/SA1388 family protein